MLTCSGVRRDRSLVTVSPAAENPRSEQYHPTADTNGRSRVVGVPVYADWNAPFLFFVAFLAELYSNVKVYYSETM